MFYRDWPLIKKCFFCWDTKKMLYFQNWWTIPLRSGKQKITIHSRKLHYIWISTDSPHTIILMLQDVTILTFQKFEYSCFFLYQTKLASLSLWKRMFLWKVISLQHNWSLAGVQNYFVYMTTIMVFYCKLQPWLKYHATWPFSKRVRASRHTPPYCNSPI